MKQNSAHRSPAILATIDVEIAYDRDLSAQAAALDRLREELSDLPATWLCTADAAEAFAGPLRRLLAMGHTIGCHGLDHTEDFRSFDEGLARERLAEAGVRILKAVGVTPRVFRGPRMTTSAGTQAALRSLGYRADLSPCARRFDFFGASAYEPRWALIRNRAYRPDPKTPFRAENSGSKDPSTLLVLPLSGLGVPLISGALYTFGCAAMLRLVDRLLASGSREIVYLFHSYEFVPVDRTHDRRPWRHRLYASDCEQLYRLNLSFLRNLQARGLRPMTAGARLDEIHEEDHGNVARRKPASRWASS